MNSLSVWRETYLLKLGVPNVSLSEWPEEWDFCAAMTACAVDVWYHLLWVLLAKKVEEVGIQNDGSADVEAEHLRSRVTEDGLLAALRTAALVGFLCL
jgi:hypothetical protein